MNFAMRINRRMSVPLVGAFATGMAPGLMAAALPTMAASGRMDVGGKSLAVAMAMYGMVAASLVGGVLADRFGRIRSIRFAAWCVVVSVLVIALSVAGSACLFAGRLMQGFGLGLFMILFPLYLTESLRPERRGGATALYQMFNSLGGIAGAFLGFCVAILLQLNSVAWRLDIGALLPIALVALVGSYGLSEGDCSWRQSSVMPTGRGGRAGASLLLAVLLLSLTSAMGVGSILHYSVLMLSEAGLDGSAANAADVCLRIVGFGAAIASVSIIRQRGHRFVLAAGSAGAAVALVGGAAVFSCLRGGLISSGVTAGVLEAVFVAAFLAAFTLGPGACVWTLAGELLPVDVRAKGMSAAMLGNQVTSSLVATAFLPVAERFGYTAVLLAFAAAASAYFALVVFLFPPFARRDAEAFVEQV